MNASVTPIGAAATRNAPPSGAPSPAVAPISPVEEIVAEMAAGNSVPPASSTGEPLAEMGVAPPTANSQATAQ